MAMGVAKPPVSERLRAMVVERCGAATLTCQFSPGGRLDGVGIRSHFYCQDCGQGLMWHEIAEGIALMATAEAIIRASGARREGKI